MDDETLLRWRLRSQRLIGPGFEPSAEGGVASVRWLGAVQSQDHEPALWSLAQRAPGVRRRDLAAAFDDGAFVRTHVLRPTWHFVPPDELRDLMTLTGPRVAASCAARWRELGLTAEVRADAVDVLAGAIAERGPLTRAELGEVLQKAGIDPAGQRLPHLLTCAELELVVCSGGLRGRQQTWALVDDRVPPAREPFDRDAALRRLALSYVTSHGPVTERDFAWWSGLTLRDVRAALELARPEIDSVQIDAVEFDAVETGGRRYWFGEPPPEQAQPAPVVRLLQSYDEYLVAYAESRDLADPHALAASMPRGGLLSTPVVVDGHVTGRWRRSLKPDRVEVEVTTLAPLSRKAANALQEEAERFAAFLELPLRLTVTEGS
jgi:winged helix DNA-binding protein